MKTTLAIMFMVMGIVSGQNLVKNPSFEAYLECPNALGTLNGHVREWLTPTEGTSDYFNSCSEVMGAPENFNGVQQPMFGNAYTGMYFYAPADYREYVQVPLKRLLRKGGEYELTFYISLAEGSDFAVKDFGVLFSYKPIEIPIRKNLSKGMLYKIKDNKHRSFEINHPKFYENKTDWLKMTVVFEARGFERYLILGNMRDNKTTRKIQTKRRESKRGAYYYIDMVSLTRVGGDVAIDDRFELEKRYVLDHILFEFDDFQIQDAARPKIAELVTYLNENELDIVIHGHTDDQGSDTYNQKLSMKRAGAISRYLIDKGVPKDAISLQGHGKEQPIDSNENPEGRKRNRRVEFEFKKRQG